MLFAYILVTSGRRPQAAELPTHPASRQQFRNLGIEIRRRWPKLEPTWIFDYARTVTLLDDLPELRRHLALLKDVGSGAMVVDDLIRLFGRVPPDRREDFFERIEPFSKYLVGLRQKSRLSELRGARLSQVVLAAEPSRYVVQPARRAKRSLDDRREQTSAATRESARARAAAADSKARELEAIRRELTGAGREASLEAIAECANERGLATTRQKPWSRQSVHRALKRSLTGGADNV